MGWPKGKPRGARGTRGGLRTETVVNLEDLLDGNNNSATENSQQEDDVESDIIVVDTDGKYGVRTYKYGYELHVRRKYNRDTLIETVNNKTKETKQTLFKAGEFGPWQLAPKPFHGKLDTLFATLHQWMIKDKISESGTFKNVAEMIRESEQRIIRCLNGD